MNMMPKMMKCLQILAVFSAFLIEFRCLSYGQQYSASLGKVPVGVISRFLMNGEKEVFSSVGNAKVGFYRKDEFPVQQSYIFPVIRTLYYPLNLPINQPTYLPSYQTQMKMKSKSKPQRQGNGVAGRRSVVTNNNSLLGGIHLSDLLGIEGLLGSIMSIEWKCAVNKKLSENTQNY